MTSDSQQVAQATLLAGNFARLTGRQLVDPLLSAAAAADWLYAAPFVVLSHTTDSDPVFNYANRTAQTLFGYDWPTFLTLPSRLSAEAPNRAERTRLLETVTRQGFIDDYSGVRIAADGRRFRIERATVWNLHTPDGAFAGQAATFAHWVTL